jgi:dienelactone hydrolase
MLKNLVRTFLLFCFAITCRADVRPFELSGYFSIDEGVPVKVLYSANKQSQGTVILMHGCGGASPKEDFWAKKFSEWGFDAVIIDSWGYHNVPWMYACKNFVDPRVRLKELYITADWIRKQPWNTGKVFMIGYSHGGIVAVQASKNLPTKGIDKAVAFYPYCWPSDHTEPKIPTQVHIGSADDWTPASRCRGMYDSWFKKYTNGEYYEYPGVYHNFDTDQDRQIVGMGEGSRLQLRTLRGDKEATKLAYKRTVDFFKN